MKPTRSEIYKRTFQYKKNSKVWLRGDVNSKVVKIDLEDKITIKIVVQQLGIPCLVDPTRTPNPKL